ncbi:hypothetical protein OG453_29010 [Streptomyces sp. NBC_01381]|uniref:hypothetical protein n=1 Tax=Streptomyces sp. NBC_01381 TaxID=2903845 RepID=UPI002251C36A|nr:hypothetical protein [Streptomyces sp. NBC_01381]MCX4670685.1 hypothetical protein [Streptomyces sp. NBC_01381]
MRQQPRSPARPTSQHLDTSAAQRLDTSAAQLLGDCATARLRATVDRGTRRAWPGQPLGAFLTGRHPLDETGVRARTGRTPTPSPCTHTVTSTPEDPVARRLTRPAPIPGPAAHPPTRLRCYELVRTRP